jgi:hypothetical protein
VLIDPPGAFTELECFRSRHYLADAQSDHGRATRRLRHSSHFLGKNRAYRAGARTEVERRAERLDDWQSVSAPNNTPVRIAAAIAIHASPSVITSIRTGMKTSVMRSADVRHSPDSIF